MHVIQQRERRRIQILLQTFYPIRKNLLFDTPLTAILKPLIKIYERSAETYCIFPCLIKVVKQLLVTSNIHLIILKSQLQELRLICRRRKEGPNNIKQ